MTADKDDIQLWQRSIINGVAGIIYATYISSFRQKTFPTYCINVPAIHQIQKQLPVDASIVDKIYHRIENTQNLKIFELIKSGQLKHIYQSHIQQLMTAEIPIAIKNKFMLDNPKSIFRIDRDIQIPSIITYTDYLVDQILLNAVMLCSQVTKVPLEYSDNMVLDSNQVITVNHQNAIVPIHFNYAIFGSNAMDLLGFVTSTEVKHLQDNQWAIKTNPHNSQIVYSLEVKTNAEV